MQLDRAISHQLERNGMTVALTAVYDLDTDDSHYEVTKKLAGKELAVKLLNTFETALTAYIDMAMEIGASQKDIYNSKIK